MRLRRSSEALGLAFFFACVPCEAQDAAAPVSIRAVPAPVSITLDGKLSEPDWARAQLIALTQQSPRPGAPTPYRTEVRVLAAPNGLYVAFDCTDPDPRLIAIHTMQRDGNVLGDDSVSIVLDTYGDHRTGYFFRVNAAAARVDGLVAGPESADLDWDGIWDARTSRTTNGWSAEFYIPARTLSFKQTLADWGVNFERNVARDRTVLRWASPTLDSFLYDLSRAGTLEAVAGLEQGKGIEISPYAVGRMKESFLNPNRVTQGVPGLDVTYRITPQMAAVFTLNTDFAETEVDSRQLNVTRFPLFFPERRAFFLEGANQYEFGLGMGQQFIPFFSRRIGLFSGRQIPINAGVKLNGRAGRWNIGFLDVQTRDTVLSGTNRVLDGNNFLASRVSYDVTPKLRVGGIVTNGSPEGGRNTMAGADALWRSSTFQGNKNLLLSAWAAASWDPSKSGDNSAYGVKLDYPNDRWDCGASWNHFGEAFNPALGFLPRPGIRRLDAFCDWRPRPSKQGPFGWVRQQFMEHRFYRVVNWRGQLESQRFFWAPVNISLESGDRFEVNWVPWFEYLPAPFEIAPGVKLPVGNYRFDRFRVEFQTSRHRPWEFGHTTWFGTFYNGTLLQQSNYVRYTNRRGRWQAGLSSEQNFGELKQGKFIQRLWQLNLSYAFNPNLVLTSFLQYDSESRNAGNNMRLRWTLRPGNDFFIVWNRGWKRLILSRDELGLVPESELLAVKLRWTFRR